MLLQSLWVLTVLNMVAIITSNPGSENDPDGGHFRQADDVPTQCSQPVVPRQQRQLHA